MQGSDDKGATTSPRNLLLHNTSRNTEPSSPASTLVHVISFPRPRRLSCFQTSTRRPTRWVDSVSPARHGSLGGSARVHVTSPKTPGTQPQSLAKQLFTATTTIFRAADHGIIPRDVLYRYDIMFKTIAYQDRKECASLRIAINTTEGQNLCLRHNTATVAILKTINSD
jgi:hypothetical protein